MLLIYVIDNQHEINVVIQEYFDIVGTIVNTVAIIYFLFIVKFIEVFTMRHKLNGNTFLVM